MVSERNGCNIIEVYRFAIETRSDASQMEEECGKSSTTEDLSELQEGEGNVSGQPPSDVDQRK